MQEMRDYSFPVFQPLSPPATPAEPTRLLEVVRSLEGSEISQKLAGVAIADLLPLRSVEDIAASLEAGNGNLSLLEWVVFALHKESWDRTVSKERAIATSRQLWQAALSQKPLFSHLVWLLATSYGDRDRSILAPSVLEAVDFGELQPRISKSKFQVLQWLSESDYAKIARRACAENLSPQAFFQSLQLPDSANVIESTYHKAAEGFIGNHRRHSHAGQWLIQCLNGMSNAIELQQVTVLLSQVSAKAGNDNPNLVEWLRRRYWHRSRPSRWSELSSSSQQALGKWIHGASWQDFRNLVRAVSKQIKEERDRYNPESHRYKALNSQLNQINRREQFWSNYSSRFERLRILVPEQSENFIRGELKRDIDVLTSDVSEPTEVCVFDFGDKYIVEFFRGRSSEMRLFSRSRDSSLEAKLFDARNLSVCQIRNLGGEKHDHTFLWQAYAERWLTSRDIHPNDGTQLWKGLNARYGQYNPETGLPLPSAEKQVDRYEALKRWQRDIDEIEAACQAEVTQVNDR